MTVESTTTRVLQPLQLVDLNQLDSIDPISKSSVGILTQGLSWKAGFQAMISHSIRHVIEGVHPDREAEIDASRILIQNPSKFFENSDVSTFFGANLTKERFQVRPTSSDQKSTLLQEVSNYLGSIRGAATLIDSASVIVDELFTNAFYNAPTEAGPKSANRNSRVHFGGSAEVVISLATTDKYLYVTCQDSFGTLLPEAVLERLLTCETLGPAGAARRGGAGAGIGFYLMFKYCSSMYVGSQAKKKTLVSCSLPLHANCRKLDELPKSLHFIS